jgi:hypothetical protein
MAFFEIQWRASTKKDLRAIQPHEVERIVAAVEKLSDESFRTRFRSLPEQLTHTAFALAIIVLFTRCW